MDIKKLDRAFDLMILGLADAGVNVATIGKFIRNGRVALGLPPEDAVKTKLKTEFAALAAETKDDPSVDRGSKAAKSRPTSSAGAGSESS